MKKLSILLLLLVLYVTKTVAQAPQKFSFQGVARNSSGQVIPNQTVALRFTIHQTSASGTTVYQETHTSQTTAAGIFNVAVGNGTATSGTFTGVDWNAGPYFLQVELDPAGGTSYVNVSTSQLLSVPYALHAGEAARWVNNTPVIQTGVQNYYAPFPGVGSGPRFLWHPSKAAFRAGYSGTQNPWENTNIGIGSTAFGIDTKAQAPGSTALGSGTEAYGHNSVAMGLSSITIGECSVAMGYGVTAKAYASLAIGRFNDISDNPFSDTPYDSDRIFQVGNGIILSARSNALTILRNGNVGIGNNVLEPEYRLDIGSRMRIRHNGTVSAGIDLNNAANTTMAFLGARSDNESAGFYFYDGANSGNWRFWVNKNGNGYLNGNLIQTSDRRLKCNIQPLTGSVAKLGQLRGYHYYWKDSARSQALQTGLIAQEVETKFPELVETNENGYKSVNYLGLIPHLLEAVNELRTENTNLQAQLAEMAMLRQQMESLKALEARLSQLVSAISEPTSFSK